jgi:hypothetical protein
MMGWAPRKFVVKHYRRGDLLDGEAFVLVPERDPAAVEAMQAYIQATPDIELRDRLSAWLDELGHGVVTQTTTNDKIPSWIATLSELIKTGGMDPETALLRIATLVRDG